MTVQPPAMLYTQGFGSRPENVEVPVISTVSPSTSDTNYPLGKRWVNRIANAEYVLTSETSSGGVTTANWQVTASPTGAVSTETGDTGTATPAAGNIKHAGTANQIVTSASGSTVTYALTGPYTPATYTAHGVLIGEGTSSIAATAAGTDGQVLTGATGADPSFGAIGIRSGLTAHGIVLGEGASAFGVTAAGSTGQTLMGSTGADPVFTGSPSFNGSVTAATTITATLGDITATNGNFVGSTAGTGLLFNSPAASGVAASPVVVNGRSGQATFTTVSIAAAADLTLTITNSAITGATTQVIYSMSGATTGSALSIKSITNSAGSSAIVVTNGTGATTSTDDIVMNFIVIN
jgi:hypothetical protein